MECFSLIKKNTYFDSVTLMGISKKLQALPGIEKVSVSMGTDMNKQLLVDGGFDDLLVKEASPNDLMIVCQHDGTSSNEEMLAQVEDSLKVRGGDGDEVVSHPRSLKTAQELVDGNVAIISVPGVYAAAEARKALNLGMHVMLFSDNVSLEDERALKELAHQKGLLVMGPDCGTSLVNGVGLCFANDVPRGDIGIVSASGTGAQELSVLLAGQGLGISQLIGTGGRDLKQEIGGITFLDALDALLEDDKTAIVALVSKPPAQEVVEKIKARLNAATKPVVVCFLGTESNASFENVVYVSTLEAAAAEVVKIKEGTLAIAPTLPFTSDSAKKQGSFVRALYCGGTLAQETKQIFAALAPERTIKSNFAKSEEEKLADVATSEFDTFLDMGDDHFTLGKPHPMIDPEVRNERIIQEAADPQTKVLLLDFVLGFGSHEDPVGAAYPALEKARELADKDGRDLVIMAYVLGTERDFQNKQVQIARLRELGVLVCDSNAQAARTAAQIVKETSSCQ